MKPDPESELETSGSGSGETEYGSEPGLETSQDPSVMLRDVGKFYIPDVEEVKEEVYDEQNPKCKAGKCRICDRSYSHTKFTCPYLKRVPHNVQLPAGVDRFCYCHGIEGGHKNSVAWIGRAGKRFCVECKVEYDHWTADCPKRPKYCWLCKTDEHKFSSYPNDRDAWTSDSENDIWP